MTFTASETGTYYIAAGAFSGRQGSYELEVTDTWRRLRRFASDSTDRIHV